MSRLQFFTFTFLLFYAQNILGQNNPVNWTIKKTYLGNNEFILDFIVEIDSSWHMYGHFDKKLPRPLGFNISMPSFVSLSGDLRATHNPLTTPTKFFEDYLYLPHYKNTVAFRQRIKIDEPKANPYAGVQVKFGAYKTKGKKTQRYLKCYCFYFDLTDLTTEEVIELNECTNQFDFCVPQKKRGQQTWYPLEVAEKSNSQDYVKWDFFYKKITSNQFQIIAEADIQNSYRLITQKDTSIEAGLLFDFLEQQNCVASNFSVEKPPEKAYYISWRKELNFITGKIRLIHDVAIDEKVSRAAVKLDLRYMVCDDLICLTENNIKVKFPLIKADVKTIFVSMNRDSAIEGDFIVAKKIE